MSDPYDGPDLKTDAKCEVDEKKPESTLAGSPRGAAREGPVPRDGVLEGDALNAGACARDIIAGVVDEVVRRSRMASTDDVVRPVTAPCCVLSPVSATGAAAGSALGERPSRCARPLPDLRGPEATFAATGAQPPPTGPPSSLPQRRSVSVMGGDASAMDISDRRHLVDGIRATPTADAATPDRSSFVESAKSSVHSVVETASCAGDAAGPARTSGNPAGGAVLPPEADGDERETFPSSTRLQRIPTVADSSQLLDAGDAGLPDTLSRPTQRNSESSLERDTKTIDYETVEAAQEVLEELMEAVYAAAEGDAAVDALGAARSLVGAAVDAALARACLSEFNIEFAYNDLLSCVSDVKTADLSAIYAGARQWENAVNVLPAESAGSAERVATHGCPNAATFQRELEVSAFSSEDGSLSDDGEGGNKCAGVPLRVSRRACDLTLPPAPLRIVRDRPSEEHEESLVRVIDPSPPPRDRSPSPAQLTPPHGISCPKIVPLRLSDMELDYAWPPVPKSIAFQDETTNAQPDLLPSLESVRSRFESTEESDSQRYFFSTETTKPVALSPMDVSYRPVPIRSETVTSHNRVTEESNVRSQLLAKAGVQFGESSSHASHASDSLPFTRSETDLSGTKTTTESDFHPQTLPRRTLPPNIVIPIIIRTPPSDECIAIDETQLTESPVEDIAASRSSQDIRHLDMSGIIDAEYDARLRKAVKEKTSTEPAHTRKFQLPHESRSRCRSPEYGLAPTRSLELISEASETRRQLCAETITESNVTRNKVYSQETSAQARMSTESLSEANMSRSLQLLAQARETTGASAASDGSPDHALSSRVSPSQRMQRRRTPPRESAQGLSQLRAVAVVASAEEADGGLFCEGEHLGAGTREALKLRDELQEASKTVSVSQSGDQIVTLRVQCGSGGAGASLGDAVIVQQLNNEPSCQPGASSGAVDSQNVGGSTVTHDAKDSDETSGHREQADVHVEDHAIAGPSTMQDNGESVRPAPVKKNWEDEDRQKQVKDEDEEEEDEEEGEYVRKSEGELQHLSKWLKTLVLRTVHRCVSVRLHDCLRSWLEVYLRGETLLPSSADGPDDVFEVPPEVVSELLRRARRPVVPVIHTDATRPPDVATKSTASSDEDLDAESDDEDDEEHLYSRVLDLLEPIGTPQDTVDDRETLRELLHEFVDAQVHKRGEAVGEQGDFLDFLRARGREYLVERLQAHVEELAERVQATVAEERTQRAGYSVGEDRRRLREWVRTSAQLVLELRLGPAGGVRTQDQRSKKYADGVVRAVPVAPPQRRPLRELLEQTVDQEIRDETSAREIQRKRLRVLLSMMKQQNLRSWLRSVEMELKGKQQETDSEPRDQCPVRKTLRGGTHDLEKWLTRSMFVRAEMMVHDRQLENVNLQQSQMDSANSKDVESAAYEQEQRQAAEGKEMAAQTGWEKHVPGKVGTYDDMNEIAENARKSEENKFIEIPGKESEFTKERMKDSEDTYVDDIQGELKKECQQNVSSDKDKHMEGEQFVHISAAATLDKSGKEPVKNEIMESESREGTEKILVMGDFGEVELATAKLEARRDETITNSKETKMPQRSKDAQEEIVSPKVKLCEEGNQRDILTANVTQLEKHEICANIEEKKEQMVRPTEELQSFDGLQEQLHQNYKSWEVQTCQENKNTENISLVDGSTTEGQLITEKDQVKKMTTNFAEAETFVSTKCEENKRQKATSIIEVIEQETVEDSTEKEDHQTNRSETIAVIGEIVQEILRNVILKFDGQMGIQETFGIIETISNVAVRVESTTGKPKSSTIIQNVPEMVGNVESKLERNTSRHETSTTTDNEEDVVDNVHGKFEKVMNASHTVIEDIVEEIIGNVFETFEEREHGTSVVIENVVQEIMGRVFERMEGLAREKANEVLKSQVIKRSEVSLPVVEQKTCAEKEDTLQSIVDNIEECSMLDSSPKENDLSLDSQRLNYTDKSRYHSTLLCLASPKHACTEIKIERNGLRTEQLDDSQNEAPNGIERTKINAVKSKMEGNTIEEETTDELKIERRETVDRYLEMKYVDQSKISSDSPLLVDITIKGHDTKFNAEERKGRIVRVEDDEQLKFQYELNNDVVHQERTIEDTHRTEFDDTGRECDRYQSKEIDFTLPNEALENAEESEVKTTGDDECLQKTPQDGYTCLEEHNTGVKSELPECSMQETEVLNKQKADETRGMRVGTNKLSQSLLLPFDNAIKGNETCVHAEERAKIVKNEHFDIETYAQRDEIDMSPTMKQRNNDVNLGDLQVVFTSDEISETCAAITEIGLEVVHRADEVENIEKSRTDRLVIRDDAIIETTAVDNVVMNISSGNITHSSGAHSEIHMNAEQIDASVKRQSKLRDESRETVHKYEKVTQSENRGITVDIPLTKGKEGKEEQQILSKINVMAERRRNSEKEQMSDGRINEEREGKEHINSKSSEDGKHSNTSHSSNMTNLENKSLKMHVNAEEAAHCEEEEEKIDDVNHERKASKVDAASDSYGSEAEESDYYFSVPLARKESIHVIKRVSETRAEIRVEDDENSGRDEQVFSDPEFVTHENEYDSLEIGRSVTDIVGQDAVNGANAEYASVANGTESENVDPQEQRERSRRLREQEAEIMEKLYKAWSHDPNSLKSLSETRNDTAKNRMAWLSGGLDSVDRRVEEGNFCEWHHGTQKGAPSDDREYPGTIENASDDDNDDTDSRQFLHEEIDVELFEQYQMDEDARQLRVPVTAVTCPGVHPGGENISEDATEMRDWLEEYIHATVGAHIQRGSDRERPVPGAGTRADRQLLPPERQGAFTDCSRRGGRAHAPGRPDAHSTTCVRGSDVALWSLDDGDDKEGTSCFANSSTVSLLEMQNEERAEAPGGTADGGGEAPTGEELLLQRFLQDATARATHSRASLLNSLRRFVSEAVERILDEHINSSSSNSGGGGGSGSGSDMASARSARRLSRSRSLGRRSDSSRERLCAALIEQARSELREWLCACVAQRVCERLGSSSSDSNAGAAGGACTLGPGEAQEGSAPLLTLATFENSSNTSLEESVRDPRAALEEGQGTSVQGSKPAPIDASANTTKESSVSETSNSMFDRVMSHVPHDYSSDRRSATAHVLEPSKFDSTLSPEPSVSLSSRQEEDVLGLYESSTTPRNVVEGLLSAYRDMLSQRLSELLAAIGDDTVSARQSLVSARGDALSQQDRPEISRPEASEPLLGQCVESVEVGDADFTRATPSSQGLPRDDSSIGVTRRNAPRRSDIALPFTCEGYFIDEFKKEQELLQLDLSSDRRLEHGDAEIVDSPPEPPGPPCGKSTEALLEPRGAFLDGPLGVVQRSPSGIGASPVASGSEQSDISAPREVGAQAALSNDSARSRESTISVADLSENCASRIHENAFQVVSKYDSVPQRDNQFPAIDRNNSGNEHLSFTACRVLSTVGSVLSTADPADITISSNSYTSTLSDSYSVHLPVGSVSSVAGRVSSATSRFPSSVGSVLPVASSALSTMNSVSPLAFSVTSPDSNDGERVASVSHCTPMSLHDRLSTGSLRLQSLAIVSDEGERRTSSVTQTDITPSTAEESSGQEERPESERVTLDIRVSWVTVHPTYDGRGTSEDIHTSCDFHDSDMCMLERLSYMHSEDYDDNTHLYNLFDDKQVQVLDFNVDEDSSTVSERGVIHWPNMDGLALAADENLQTTDGCVLAFPVTRTAEEFDDEVVASDIPITVATNSVDDLSPTRMHETTIVVDDFSGIVVPGMQGYWFGENGRLSAQIQGNSSPVPLHNIVDDVVKPEGTDSTGLMCPSGHAQCISGCGCPGDLDPIFELRPENRDDTNTTAPSHNAGNVLSKLSPSAALTSSRSPAISESPEDPATPGTPATTEPTDPNQPSTSDGRERTPVGPDDEEAHLAMALRQHEQHDSPRLRAPVTTAANRAARVRPEAPAQPAPAPAPARSSDNNNKSSDSDEFDVESKAESEEEDEEEKDSVESKTSKEEVFFAATEQVTVTPSVGAISSECIAAAATVQSFHETPCSLPVSSKLPFAKRDEHVDESITDETPRSKADSIATQSTKNARDSVDLLQSPTSNEDSSDSATEVTTHSTAIISTANSIKQPTAKISEQPIASGNEQSTASVTAALTTKINKISEADQLQGVDQKTPELDEEYSFVEIVEDDSNLNNSEGAEGTDMLNQNTLDLVLMHDTLNEVHVDNQLHGVLDATSSRETQEQSENTESREVASHEDLQETAEAVLSTATCDGQQDASVTVSSSGTEEALLSNCLDSSSAELVKNSENPLNLHIQTVFSNDPISSPERHARDDSGSVDSANFSSTEIISDIYKRLDLHIQTAYSFPNQDSNMMYEQATDEILDFVLDRPDTSPSVVSEGKAQAAIEMEQCIPKADERGKDGEIAELATTFKDTNMLKTLNSADEMETMRIKRMGLEEEGLSVRTENVIDEVDVVEQGNTASTGGEIGAANVSEIDAGENNGGVAIMSAVEDTESKRITDEMQSNISTREVETPIMTSLIKTGKVIDGLETNIQDDMRTIIEKSNTRDMKIKHIAEETETKIVTKKIEEKQMASIYVSAVVKSVSAAGEVGAANGTVVINSLNEIVTLPANHKASLGTLNDVNDSKATVDKVTASLTDMDRISVSSLSPEASLSKEHGSNESLPHTIVLPLPVAGPSGYPSSPTTGLYSQRPSTTDSSSGEDDALEGMVARAQEAASFCRRADESAQCAEVCGDRYTESYIRHFTCSQRPADRNPLLRLGPPPEEESEDEGGMSSRAWADDDELERALRPAYSPPKASDTDSDEEEPPTSVASSPADAFSSQPERKDAVRTAAATSSDPGLWPAPDLPQPAASTPDSVPSTLLRGSFAGKRKRDEKKKKAGVKARFRSFFSSAFGLGKKNPHGNSEKK